jgi:hypothetical protein
MSKKINGLNKANIKDVRDNLTADLMKLGDKYGMTFQMGNIRYQADQMKFTLTAYVNSQHTNANKVNVNQVEFNKHAFAYGFSAEDFGKVFTVAGNQYQVSGIKPKARKYPILGTNVATGKVFKFPAMTVKANINKLV